MEVIQHRGEQDDKTGEDKRTRADETGTRRNTEGNKLRMIKQQALNYIQTQQTNNH